MPSIYYNKTLGNYRLTYDGKTYTHPTLQSAQRQQSAILRVQRKRADRKRGLI